MGDAMANGMGGDFEAGAMGGDRMLGRQDARTPGRISRICARLPQWNLRAKPLTVSSTLEAEEEARWKVHYTPTRTSPDQSELSIGCRPLRRMKHQVVHAFREPTRPALYKAGHSA
jgi:hypothetical protein